MKISCIGITILHFPFILTIFSAQAQNTDTTQPKTCLFDHFMPGVVLEKNGTTHEALLNYNTDDQSVLFKQDHQNMTLTGLNDLDTVYIGEKKFIPAEDKFYAVATTAE